MLEGRVIACIKISDEVLSDINGFEDFRKEALQVREDLFDWIIEQHKEWCDDIMRMLKGR